MLTRFSLVIATAVLTATQAPAATFVSVFDFSWTGTWYRTGDGSPNSDGLWGITASSEFINPYPDASVRFDPVNGAYRVEGRVDIAGTLGSFTGADVIALNLDVISTNDYRIASYSIAKEDLRVGIMSGSIVEDPVTFGRRAELTALRMMQRVDPTDPTQKFEQIFGCSTIGEGCVTSSYLTPFPAYGSGNPVPPSSVNSYAVVSLTDGRSDPCCGARSNALRFFYETPEQALASFRLTWNRDASYTLPGDAPEGLPAPVPLPAALPLMLGALGFLGVAARRRRNAAPTQS